MERYTFDEIRNFSINDIFYSRNKRYHVDSVPTYYNTSEFYGDYSEKVEWTGYCETEGEDYQHQHTFVIQSNEPEGEATNPMIFKSLTQGA